MSLSDHVIEHEQLDLHAALPDLGIYDHHLRAAWPCAVPGVSLTDYSKNALQKGWGSHCVGPFATITLVNGVRITVDSRIAELVTLLGNATLARGYQIRQADTGAYVCRYIAGTTIWSNHAWGLAVDIDWQSNPQHSPLTTDEPLWLRQLWNRYGFAWGGDYVAPTVPDAMHHEFMGTPEQAVAATLLARAELSSVGPVPPPPPPPAPAPLPAMPAPVASPLTGHPEIPGFDCSYSRPGGAAMHAGWFTFVVGYVSPTAAKNLTPANYADYRNSGLGVALVFEDTASRVTGGQAAGATDGVLADSQADALGYPLDAPIFFAVDYDAQPGDYPALQAYAAAFNSKTKRPVGVYGSGAVLNLLVTPGAQPVQYGWLAMSTGWSGYATVPPAKVHLLQRFGHPGWPVPGGVPATAFDEDVALLPLPLAGWTGAAPTPAPPPPPPPPPAGNPQVRADQANLTDTGFPCPITGIWDPESQQACKNFQYSAHLPADGICGSVTRAALAKVPSWHGPFYGDGGYLASRWQQKLHDHGWHIAVNNVWDDHSRSILRQYQTEKRLQITGEGNAQSWTSLYCTTN